jgi:hypothetical protein
MHVFRALSVTFALIVVMVFINAVTGSPWFGFLLVLATALWAAVDSSILELHKYRRGVEHPILAFLAAGCL